MARGNTVVTGIVELTRICDERYATDLGWFALLGSWVTDESNPQLQQLFATAAHRHAWHAELWAQRRPAVPHDAVHALPEPATLEPDGDRAARYASHLDTDRAALAELRSTVDPELDPSTTRTIDLVDADLASLRARLP